MDNCLRVSKEENKKKKGIFIMIKRSQKPRETSQ